MKPVCALDVDGIVLDLTPAVIEYVKDHYDATITEGDITDWDWDYALSLPDGLTSAFWAYMWTKPALPYPGAVEFVQRLKEKFSVFAISTRPRKWEGLGAVAYRAAQRDFGQIPFDDTCLVERHRDKAEIIDTVDAAVFVEDNPMTAAYCHHETGVKTFLMSRPWNQRCCTITKAWTRVHSYNELLARLEICPQD